MLVVDFHIHPTTKGLLPWVFDWMKGFLPPGEDPQRYLDETVTKEGLIRLLDENGVDYAVALAELNPRVTGIITNEELAECCRGLDRLIPFADVNPHMIADPAAELERCVLEWGFKGAKLYPVYQLFQANDRVLYPFYEKAQELGVPVMVHTGSSIFQGVRLKYGDPQLLEDVALDFPDLTLILVHGGRGFWYDVAFFLSRAYPRIYLEVSGLPPRYLLDYFPDLESHADKVLFGSDWPGPNPKRNIEAIQALPISEEAKVKILGANAARILGLDTRPRKA
ncbi:MAG: amidohydrolase family protein [Dehalococcoidia bacterium]|nr:amidohydrolase family protein [Dehalococcoidia bacterium]